MQHIIEKFKAQYGACVREFKDGPRDIHFFIRGHDVFHGTETDMMKVNTDWMCERKLLDAWREASDAKSRQGMDRHEWYFANGFHAAFMANRQSSTPAA